MFGISVHRHVLGFSFGDVYKNRSLLYAFHHALMKVYVLCYVYVYVCRRACLYKLCVYVSVFLCRRVFVYDGGSVRLFLSVTLKEINGEKDLRKTSSRA